MFFGKTIKKWKKRQRCFLQETRKEVSLKNRKIHSYSCPPLIESCNQNINHFHQILLLIIDNLFRFRIIIKHYFLKYQLLEIRMK